MVRRVAVVGAGVAGLAAARRLAAGGIQTQVFEKARGPGGRISTRREAGLAFDHGAQYFTARHPDFVEQVDDWVARGVVQRWGVPVTRLRAGTREQEPERSARFVGAPRMSSVARELSKGLGLQCGIRIASVEGGPGRWELVPEDGAAVGGFDAVLVATPAPQAVALLRAVPHLAARVAAIEMHPCLAVMVHFADPLDAGFGGAFVEDSPLAWVAWNSSKPQRTNDECWVLHATPEWSGAHLEDPADTVSDVLLGAFAEAIDARLPRVVQRRSHRWRHARTVAPLGESCLWDEAAGIGACGDWALGERVEDGFRSGDALGRAVRAALVGPAGGGGQPESRRGMR